MGRMPQNTTAVLSAHAYPLASNRRLGARRRLWGSRLFRYGSNTA